MENFHIEMINKNLPFFVIQSSEQMCRGYFTTADKPAVRYREIFTLSAAACRQISRFGPVETVS